jgi:hypothetical protein
MRKVKWAEEELNIVRQYYITKNKDFILSKLNNRTWKSVEHASKRFGLKRGGAANRSIVDYFDNWSNEMAYILGFIAADGCVGDNRDTLQINLSYKDIKHLKRIRDRLAPRNKICVYWHNTDKGQYKKCIFSVGSKYMKNRLMELGIKPRKSLDLEFPYVPKKYIRDFIRGYFDGDGGLEAKKIVVDFIGTYNFLDTLSDIFSKECLIVKIVPKKKKDANAYHIAYGTKSAVRVLDYIYSDLGDGITLERKFNRYKEIKENWTNYRTEWNIDEIDILKDRINRNIKPKEIVRFLDNRTLNSIYHKTQRLRCSL